MYNCLPQSTPLRRVLGKPRWKFCSWGSLCSSSMGPALSRGSSPQKDNAFNLFSGLLAGFSLGFCLRTLP